MTGKKKIIVNLEKRTISFLDKELNLGVDKATSEIERDPSKEKARGHLTFRCQPFPGHAENLEYARVAHSKLTKLFKNIDGEILGPDEYLSAHVYYNPLKYHAIIR